MAGAEARTGRLSDAGRNRRRREARENSREERANAGDDGAGEPVTRSRMGGTDKGTAGGERDLRWFSRRSDSEALERERWRRGGGEKEEKVDQKSK